MPDYTSRLALAKPRGGSSGSTPAERVDIDVLNGNFDKIDAATGSAIATSTTRPTPYVGQILYETDTRATRVRVSADDYALVSDFSAQVPTGAALPQNGTAKDAPPAGTQFQKKIQYVVTGTNGTGAAAAKILFSQPFANACIDIRMTTISGSAQNPVINAGLVDRLGFTPIWTSSPNATVGFTFEATGW